MRRSVLLMLLLALVLASCGQPSVHSSDELQEDTHLAQQLFLADFSRNYEVLYVLTGDILEAAGDLSVVRKETELMENTSTRLFLLPSVRDPELFLDGMPAGRAGCLL